MNARPLEPPLTEYLYRRATAAGLPLSGTFELTPLCNLDCRMCYVHLNKDQLKDKKLGDTLLIPSSMLRAEGDMFLDSVTVDELSQKLDVKIVVVDNDGYALIDAIFEN